MKIKILSTSSGKIVSALMPERASKNMASCGPLLTGKREFVEVELPKGTDVADISGLLRRSKLKKVNNIHTLDISKPGSRKK